MADVLIVEDEQSLLHTLRYNLGRAGHQVRLCSNGRLGMEMVLENPPDLLLLDLMLPEVDGLEICRRVRREATNPAVSHVPILILSARDQEIERVVGLQVGADDYMTKPFSMQELLARVKALLRRSEMVTSAREIPERLRAEDLVVDLAARRVVFRGTPLHLKPREFDLLAYLMRHAGQVLERERLLRNVWGFESGGDTRTVDVHVRWLRAKIEPDPANPVRIQTVRGAGYMFVQ